MTSQPFENTPIFSVIIPTYQRPLQLSECLQALAHLDYPKDQFEVIVVDDESPNSPKSIVESFRHQLNVSFITKQHGGPGRARNEGATQATGDFLVFIDDDCEVPKDWLKKITARIASHPEDMIGGYTQNGLPDNLFSSASQAMIDYLYLYFYSDTSTRKQIQFFTSNNFVVPTQKFRSIGGFHSFYTLAASEDREICRRWLEHEFQMIYAPEVVIFHKHFLTLHSFWRQHFNYGRGGFHFHQVNSLGKQHQIKMEPVSFYLNLLWFPFTQKVRIWKAAWLVVLLMLSQIANGVGFFSEWIRQPLVSSGLSEDMTK